MCIYVLYLGDLKANFYKIREVVTRNIGVKASGGIRTFKDAQALIDAGATRLGTSSGINIIEEYAKIFNK